MYIRPMSETYQSKRERWQRLLESLPDGLRTHISLRNVEAVAALPPQAQERLKEAIQAGLKRLPGAVDQLRVDPNTPITDLLHPQAQIIAKTHPSTTDIQLQTQNELADLIQSCFPDMPRVSAQALADSDVMDIARVTAFAHQQILTSSHLRTDFVMMVLYGLMRQSLENLEEVIEKTPALLQAFNQSSLPWKPNDWRKQNA